MKIVIQRVKRASVAIDDMVISQIEEGLVLLVGIGKGDTGEIAQRMAEKISTLRIFEDPQGKMNLSIKQTGAQILAVPQFTLLADLKQGRRPSFDDAENPEKAKKLFEEFVESLRLLCGEVETGSFKEHMLVKIENDGPVTFILDSKML